MSGTYPGPIWGTRNKNLPLRRQSTTGRGPGYVWQDRFNPFTTNSTNNVYYLIYDRLVEMGADGNIYPHLLKEWNVSKDGLQSLR
jgi:hypothetical protein